MDYIIEPSSLSIQWGSLGNAENRQCFHASACPAKTGQAVLTSMLGTHSCVYAILVTGVQFVIMSEDKKEGDWGWIYYTG